jgi:two-component system osmolarity sensor histidine kinase EnvZ
VRAALFSAAPDRRPELFLELSAREGIRLLPAEVDDPVEPMADDRLMNLVRRELVTRLGPQTRIAGAVDGIPGFWVSFRLEEHDEEEFWIGLPRERAARHLANHWLTWGLVALSLALAMAGLIATRLARPLKILARSATVLGQGQMPAPVPETGVEEIRHLAAAFNQMAADLERHERDRAEVLAGISHDLRTPITRLRLEAELSINDDGARQAVIADIEQMESVISQFMDYARGDVGEESIAVDPGELLSNIAERQAALGRPLHLEISPLPVQHLRPKAISRAINNLIDNAWKYGANQVTLGTRVDGNRLQIDVIDNGPGIPADQCERMKRPFTRLESARTGAGGTGLGLAIVNRIARLHGGTLELLPAPGGGLLGRLDLPLQN